MMALRVAFVLCLLVGAGLAFESNKVENSDQVPRCKVVQNMLLSAPAGHGQVNLTELRCNVKNLQDQVPLDEQYQLASVSSIHITCSIVHASDSSIEGGFVPSILRYASRRNVQIRRISLEHCLLRKLSTGTLSSLPGATRIEALSINSTSAPVGWGLSVESGTFSGLPSLVELDLSSSYVWSIPRDTLCPLTGLKHLNLSYNKLQDVKGLAKGPEVTLCPNCPLEVDPQEDFNNSPRCLRSVQTLDLSHNLLTNLPDHFLSSLKFLKELRLAWNLIDKIGDKSLAGLKSLQKLDLTGNKLTSLPHDLFSDAKSLSEIRLADNNLGVLGPGVFSGLKDLSLLDLARNKLMLGQIGVGKDTFRGLERLRELDLTSNLLDKLEAGTFSDLRELQVLRLAGNQLESIPDNAFVSLGNLHALELTGNQLKVLPKTLLRKLRALHRLGASHNRITALDYETFVNCSDLRELELASNQFTEINASVLSAVPLLEKLDLSDNQLSALPIFPPLSLLRDLNLCANNIKKMPKNNLAQLPALWVLNISNNELAVIENGALRHNVRLAGLIIDANKLTDLDSLLDEAPASLKAIKASDNLLTSFNFNRLPGNMEWLDLHRNRLTQVRHSRDHEGHGGRSLTSLTFLDLNHNQLQRLDSFNFPDHVKQLYVANNSISSVAPNTFAEKRNLRLVDLSDNQLTELELNALQLGQKIPENETLPSVMLARNPFNCLCKMDWLQQVNTLANGTRRYPSVIDITSVTCSLTHARAVTSPVSALNLAPSQYLCPYETHCYPLCHCCDYDACDCEMTCPTGCACYHDAMWGTNVVDCSAQQSTKLPERIPMDVTQLFLDGNNLHELTSHVFIGKRKLEMLYLNASKISSIQNRTFKGLDMLTSLFLQGNLLTELQGYEFSGLHVLNELHLENNAIISIHEDTFSGLSMLRKLYLDGNRLVNFVPWAVLPHLKKHVLVSMGGNWWDCRECDVMKQLSSWTDSVGQMLCLDTQHWTSGRFNVSVADTLKKCLDQQQNSAISAPVQVEKSSSMSTSVMAVLSLMTVVLIIISIVVFVFRRRVLAVWRSTFGSGATVVDDPKLFDAYVVYSQLDEMLVTKEMSPLLGMSSLCLHHRDLLASHEPASVYSAIDASHCTVMFISSNFLQTDWPNDSLRVPVLNALLSKNRSKRLVVVMLHPQNQANYPSRLWNPLCELLTGVKVLKYGETHGDRLRFTDELRKAVPIKAACSVNWNGGCKLYSSPKLYSMNNSPYWCSRAHDYATQKINGYISSSSADGDDGHHTTSTDDAADSGDSVGYSSYCRHASDLSGPLNHVYSTIDEHNVTTSSSMRPSLQQQHFV
ncbi:toll-like receptor Tollo [Cloeon dipterum]|uniref:toll-like receptor Tollo n=1 Tax=Cloeon dipterum TaxID=197152 RepID=UPI00321F9AE2